MKLYATVTSERDSRPAKKGGDNFLEIELFTGNKRDAYIYYGYPDRLYITNKHGEQGCLMLSTLEWYDAPKQPPHAKT